MWAFSQGRNVLVIFDRKRPSDVVREFFWGEDGCRFVVDDNLESGLRSWFVSLPPTLEIVEGATDVSWVADFKNEGFNWSEPRLTIGQVTHLGVSV